MSHVRRAAGIGVVGAALVLSSSLNFAAAADPGTPKPGELTQELLGFEVTPLSLRLTDVPTPGGTATPSRLHGAPGGTVRLLRHRWKVAYVVPVEAGLYISQSSSGDILFAHLETEVGIVVPGTDRRLELGLGIGAGILEIQYGAGCDGACSRGGAGPMISPVLRYLLVTSPNFTVGTNIRLIVPLAGTDSEQYAITGFGSIALAGIDVAFGVGGSR